MVKADVYEQEITEMKMEKLKFQEMLEQAMHLESQKNLEREQLHQELRKIEQAKKIEEAKIAAQNEELERMRYVPCLSNPCLDLKETKCKKSMNPTSNLNLNSNKN